MPLDKITCPVCGYIKELNKDQQARWILDFYCTCGNRFVITQDEFGKEWEYGEPMPFEWDEFDDWRKQVQEDILS